MSKYVELQKEFQNKIISIIKEILSKYNNSLELKIEDINLLQSENNCIESSTAIGFLLEEFISNKLICATNQNKNNKDEIFVQRKNNKGTQNSSYDFFCEFKDNLFLVNIKVDKGNNNAIAAINQLYVDYVQSNNEKEKHFFVLKFLYFIENQKIKIKNIDSFFLEEIDFSNGYRADSRNWSETFNNNSGRLQISKSFLKNNKAPQDIISEKRTKEQLEKMYNNIIKKIKGYLE